jgi:hypothetical protein
MNAKAVEKAIGALDGVIQIARNDMLVQGHYLSSDTVNEDLAKKGSICRGHTACFVGSLFVGSRASFKQLLEEDPFGVWERKDFMNRRPHLKLAYEAANAAAKRYIDRTPELRSSIRGRVTEPDEGWAEALFEGGFINRGYDYDRYQNYVRREMIKVCQSAKAAIKREYAEVLAKSNKKDRELVAA